MRERDRTEGPKILKDEVTSNGASETEGPPNAEAHGIWRILRNSLLLAFVAFAGVVAWFEFGAA